MTKKSSRFTLGFLQHRHHALHDIYDETEIYFAVFLKLVEPQFGSLGNTGLINELVDDRKSI
jgi:hypothetical protein